MTARAARYIRPMKATLLAAALAASMLTGCRPESATGIEGDFVGDYRVTAIDGKALPWTIVNFACGSAVTSGNLRLASDFTAKGTINYRYDCKPNGLSAPVTASWTMEGEWRVEGGALLLVQDANPTRDSGPVMTSGARLDDTVGAPITLSVTFRDCTGANAGHCVEADAVLQLTPA